MMKYLKNSWILFVVIMFTFPVTQVLAADPFGSLISGTKIYFSHIAIQEGWETEIAVINPTSEAAAGVLTFYDSKGHVIGNNVAINLSANGRYQAKVGAEFANYDAVEYIVLTSEVFGLKGYSKFYRGGIRASIVASGPRTSGLFTKVEPDGWTGIAFINTAAAAANIKLTAYNDNGETVAVETMQVGAGEKVVNVVDEIFTGSIAGATYVRYISDRGVVGFFLNGSSDNTMMDGSQAL